MKTKLLFLIFLLTLGSNYAQQNIIGGDNTTIENNPWQISMRSTNTYYVAGFRNEHICGGSILSPDWILTAAHCVTNTTNGNVIGVNEIRIVAGITMRNGVGQNRNVTEIVRHPNYNNQTYENDVALIRLTAPLVFDARVRPILLTNSENLSAVGTTGTVTGWGNTMDGVFSPADQLQILTMPIISRTEANNLSNLNVSNNMIPLLRSGTGVAPGDSGGPLSVVSNGIRYLIGCSSWGESPKDQKPTIYTNLFNYRNWIMGRVPLPTLTGPDCVCASTNSTIALANANAGNVVWARSPNITLVNNNNMDATIQGLSGSRGLGWVTATFNGMTLRHDLWVGQPNPPSSISGPTTVRTGALVNYSSTVSPGATSYVWWGPHPYSTVTNFNYSSRTWQLRSTTGRYLDAFTGTTKTNGLIQVMGRNKCGIGGVKTLYVQHSSGGGGGGAIPLRVRLPIGETPSSDVMYPNPANSYLNIYLKDKESYNNISVSLTTLEGKVVYNATGKYINGIDTSSFADGIYVLNIIMDGEVMTENILIQH